MKVKFRRVRGRIIPIRDGSNEPHKPNQALRAAGYGLGVVSGVVSGLSLVGGVKRVATGQATSFGLDFASHAALGAAHLRGPASKSMKAKAIGKDIAISEAMSWTTFGAVALSNRKTREAGIKYAKNAVAGGRVVAKKAIAALISYKLRHA